MCVTSLLGGPWADFCGRFMGCTVNLVNPFTVQPIKRPQIGPWTTQERRNTHFM